MVNVNNPVLGLGDEIVNQVSNIAFTFGNLDRQVLLI